MHNIPFEAANFIDLNYMNVLYLFIVGFIGGLVSGFIGSGGAFVLTPGMMSLGVPGLVAVASNMCHKFPKALVGAIKRAKYGQVDVKLGLVFGVFAEAGVFYGAHIQEKIKAAFGDAGSNLYVSVAFVVVLAVVGGLILRDAVKTYRSGNADAEEKLSSISKVGAVGQYTGDHGLFQKPESKGIIAFHSTAWFCHRHACGDYCSRRFYRRAFDDLCAWRAQPDGFGDRTCCCVRDGSWRIFQVCAARFG